MSTRLYMTNKASEYSDVIPRGSWDVFQTSNLNFLIDTNKFGDASSLVEMHFTRLPETWSGLYKTGTYRGISRRLTPQTISGTFNLLTFAMETGSTEVYTRVYAYILDTTNDTTGGVVAVLLNYEDLPTVGYNSPYWSRSFITPVQFGRIQSITPFTVPDDGKDYRLIIEFGAIAGAADSTDFMIRQEMGARKDDLTPLDNVVVSGGATYFEFSSDILFKDALTPPNSEIEFALDVSNQFPFTTTVSPFKTTPVWYKSMISVNGVLGFLSCASGRRAKTALYIQEVADEPAVKLWIESEYNGSVNHSVQAGRYVYFKTWPELPTGPTYTLKADLVYIQGSQSGDLLLTPLDSNPNFYDPTVPGLYSAMIRQTNGSIRTLNGKFVGSNLGVSLYAGRFGIASKSSKELFIYSRAPKFDLLSRVPSGLPLSIIAIGTDLTSFYLLGAHPAVAGGENKFIYGIDQNGGYLSRQWILPIADVSPLMGVNRTSTILYYGQGIVGGKVNRHDLVTNLPLTPFATTPGAAYIPAFIIVMSDNSICCLFRFTPIPSNQDKLVHYAPDGTVLHTLTLAAIGTGVVQYIAHSSDDSADKIWVWYYNIIGAGALDGFIQYKLSDTSIVQQFGGDLYLFNNGKGPADQPCSSSIWGAQSQSAMITMMDQPDISGIYFLNSAKKHDVYYKNIDLKIPDPTIRTAFMGE